MNCLQNPLSNIAYPPITLDIERLYILSSRQAELPLLGHDWEAACHQYRCFLGLKQRHPSQLLVPPAAAMQLWKTHILDTRSYRSDCGRLLGRFLDHLPSLGLYGETDRQQLHQARHTCCELLFKHYGPDALLD